MRTLRDYLADEGGAQLLEYLLMAVFLGGAIAWAIGHKLREGTGAAVDRMAERLKE